MGSVLQNMGSHVYAAFVRVNILVWNPNHKLWQRYICHDTKNLEYVA